MGRVRSLRIRNFKSIGDEIEVQFPPKQPLILIGENNAGKSNIVRALELLLGETWPGSYDPEDHDFHNRDRSIEPLEIRVTLEGVTHADKYKGTLSVEGLVWRYEAGEKRPFRMILSGGIENPYPSNDVREQCFCIAVGADRRLSYQLSYTSKYTFLSRLMRRFHRALSDDEARVEALRESFEQTKGLFLGIDAFATFTTELQKQVSQLSGNLKYGLKVDFSAYDPSNFFHALRVFPYEGKDVRAFSELGTGQEQIFAISFAYAYAKAFHGDGSGLIVVIEEPEAHLHPLAQEWMGQVIRDVAAAGVQVVVTTHSPKFLDMSGLDGFALARKIEGGTHVVQWSHEDFASYCREHGAPRAGRETVLPFYAAVATEDLLSGLFARRVLLVEGPTEALALPVYLDRVGLNTLSNGIAVLPVHGVGNLAKWWRFFSAYGLPVYVAFDNDARDDDQEIKRKDLLQTLGINAQEWPEAISTKQWLIGESYCVFGRNFEETLRANFGEAYRALEGEALEQFGLSAEQAKPLVARYVAERLEKDDQAPGWKGLEMLSKAICPAGGQV